MVPSEPKNTCIDIRGTFTDAIFAYGPLMMRQQKRGDARLSAGGQSCKRRVIDIAAADIDESLTGQGGSWRELTAHDIA